MKRIALFLTLIATFFLLFSCARKKQQVETPDISDRFIYTFTKEDTTEIMSQVNDFISRLEKKDVRGAVEMIHFLSTGDSIVPLTPVRQRRQAISLQNVMGVKYEFNRLVLRSYTDNEAKIDIILFDKPVGDTRPNLTTFHLRPVKFEGKWYLTVWDTITNTNQDSNKD